jgi:ElaB/YqjD/DUF883 family membrane-anchored ribosome-binding protein
LYAPDASEAETGRQHPSCPVGFHRADAFTDAAHDVYGQARESEADVADAANTAARKTMGSFEKVIRNTIETQPYTAVAIALGIGWLLGRMHRPV